jgi:hypothetical protein
VDIKFIDDVAVILLLGVSFISIALSQDENEPVIVFDKILRMNSLIQRRPCDWYNLRATDPPPFL